MEYSVGLIINAMTMFQEDHEDSHKIGQDELD